MENGHANDCEQGSKTVGTMDDYTRKLMSMAKTTKDAHAVDKPCKWKWYLFGLCKFKNKCKMVHDKGVPAHMIGCALPKAKKHTFDIAQDWTSQKCNSMCGRWTRTVYVLSPGVGTGAEHADARND